CVVAAARGLATHGRTLVAVVALVRAAVGGTRVGLRAGVAGLRATTGRVATLGLARFVATAVARCEGTARGLGRGVTRLRAAVVLGLGLRHVSRIRAGTRDGHVLRVAALVPARQSTRARIRGRGAAPGVTGLGAAAKGVARTGVVTALGGGVVATRAATVGRLDRHVGLHVRGGTRLSVAGVVATGVCVAALVPAAPDGTAVG